MTDLDFSLLSLRDLLSLDACTRCGECIPACPIEQAAGQDHSTAFTKIAQGREAWQSQCWGLLGRLMGRKSPDLQGMSLSAYDCTLCGRCHVVCPVGIDTHHLWVNQRRQLSRASAAPEEIARLAATVRETGNIAGRPPEERLSWLANAPLGGEVAGPPEVLLFTGCLSSLYPQAFGLSQALLALLRLAGVRVGLLGAEEVCCGFPLYAAGREEEALSLAHRNLDLIQAQGATTVVTPCPSCYYTLSECYPRWLGGNTGLRVLHGVEYLDEVSEALRPRLGRLDLRLTYHDPCDLGRLSGIYEIPRRLLGLIPGLTLVEMEENREMALCCGGGGDVEMVNAKLSEAISDLRLSQAAATGAEAIATACPQCKRALGAAARRDRRRLPTYDVAELLLRSATIQDTPQVNS